MPENLQDWLGWFGGNAIAYFIPFLLVISVLVFVHEWGHYIVARMCGVKVETFSIGFGRKLFSFKDKSGTEWRFALIPLGGYVKMFGDTDPASAKFTESVVEEKAIRKMTADERAQSFFGKSVWQRMAIVAAGPAINFIFAIILLSALFMTVGRPITPPVAAAVVEGGAAQKAGIMPMDRIISINGAEMRRFSDIQRSVAVSLNEPLSIVIDRAGERIEIDGVEPRVETLYDRFGFQHSRGLMGVISSGNAIALDGIMAVNGESGDIASLLKSRMGQVVTLTMTPVGEATPQALVVRLQPELNGELISGTGENAGLVLAPLAQNNVVTYGFVGAVKESLYETWFVTTGTLRALGQMIIGTRSPQELGGLIRIGAVTGDAAAAGFAALVTLAALLSINLGLINLFPIPMLDGGHLLFYSIEAIKGRPVPERVQDMALRFGFYVLIGLMLFANLNDILQLAR